MYGWTALENPKMSMTSTSLAVSRVCVTVDSSSALTTARSIEMFGLASSNVSLNVSRNSTIGGFWWTSTRSVTSSADAGAAPPATAVAEPASSPATARVARQ